MDKAAVTDRLRKFEGSIPHMYRCTGGEVTIGIGHALQTAEDAEKLRWAGPDTVGGDWGRVAAAPAGNVASSYADLTTCRMGDSEIDRLCAMDIDTFEEQLRASLPNWDSYPELAKQALFDMAFNLGMAGLMKFPTMLAAVDRSDWETAAKESHRKGIQEARNEEIAGLFRSSVGAL